VMGSIFPQKPIWLNNINEIKPYSHEPVR